MGVACRDSSRGVETILQPVISRTPSLLLHTYSVFRFWSTLTFFSHFNVFKFPVLYGGSWVVWYTCIWRGVWRVFFLLYSPVYVFRCEHQFQNFFHRANNSFLVQKHKGQLAGLRSTCRKCVVFLAATGNKKPFPRL